MQRLVQKNKKETRLGGKRAGATHLPLVFLGKKKKKIDETGQTKQLKAQALIILRKEHTGKLK